MSDIIEIKNLSFSYEKGKTVLDNISLSIKKNTIDAILGANGSGKSTLLDCLAGINKPSGGTVLVDGKEIDSYTSSELARKVAYISQSTAINIDYTVREFVMFGRNPYLGLGKAPSDEDYRKCDQYAKKLGITRLLDKSITRISGGERQLCFICRALTQESEILVFDEPLSSLDYGNQIRLLTLFVELQKEGKTIIFTTHNPMQLIEYGRNVVVLSDGVIKAEGPAKRVLTPDIISDIYGIDTAKLV